MLTRSARVLLIAIALVAGACSGDDATPTTTGPPTQTQAPSTTPPPPPPTTAPVASSEAELSATLQVEGRPLAGVEVFLGINPPAANAGYEARYACTDEDGVVVFSGVPRGALLVAIAGPGLSAGCDNKLFVDTEASPPYPLAVTTILPGNASINGDRDLGIVSVPRLPGGAAIAREAMAVYESCIGEGDVTSARNHLAEYERLIESQQSLGNLTNREAVVLDGHTSALRFTVEADNACTNTAPVGPVPLLFDWDFTPEDARPVVTLIDPGSEPRQVRVYSLEPGMVHESSLRLEFSQSQEIDGVPADSSDTTIDVAFTSEVIGVAEGGFIIVSTTNGYRVDSSEPVAQSQLESTYASLVGTSAAQLVAPSGGVIAVERPTGLGQVDDPSTVVAGATPPLPAEPIGVGAVWTVESSVISLGIETATTSTYTLTAVDGPLLSVELESVHDVDVDALNLFPGLEDVDVTMTQSGSGNAVWDLTATVPQTGTSRVDQLLIATATFGGEESTLEQTTTFIVEIPSPGPLGPPEGTSFFDITDNSHVEGEVAYEQDPPAGGPHNPTPQNCGFYDAPVANENAVHSLEHGAVWITYRPGLSDDQVKVLRDLAGTPYTLVSPYPGLDTAVVASAWGVQLRLESAFDQRLSAFVDWFAAGPQTPEPGVPCDGGIGEPLP